MTWANTRGTNTPRPLPESCPRCGKPLDGDVPLTIQQRKIVDTVIDHTPEGGIGIDKLAARVYGRKPTDTELASVRVQICFANKDLARIGRVIKRERSDKRFRYLQLEGG